MKEKHLQKANTNEGTIERKQHNLTDSFVSVNDAHIDLSTSITPISFIYTKN